MSDFWNHPDRVERFAARAPDHRLVRLLEAHPAPEELRVLDLGCAGGRNTEYLVRRGAEAWALDAAEAMVTRTRERVAAVAGAEAAARVRVGRMDDLGAWADGAFDLVVALGVFHSARTWAEWGRAADEVARVLAEGGWLLFNQFTPAVDLTGEGVSPASGERRIYEGLPGGRAVLLEAAELDEAWAERGLRPVEPTETVRVELDQGGRRVSVNALYERA